MKNEKKTGFFKWLFAKYKAETLVQDDSVVSTVDISTKSESGHDEKACKSSNSEGQLLSEQSTEERKLIVKKNQFLKELKNTKEIILESDDGSELQKFMRTFPDTSMKSKQFRILSSENAKNLASAPSSAIVQGGTILALTKGGIYKATVSPSKLMSYKDGLISSMMKGPDGKFIGHAGFASANAAVFAPIVIMQVLSIITSQYYLNGINKQLTAIKQELDKLKNLAYKEDQGKLFAIREILSTKLNSKQPLIQDLNVIDECKKDALSIAARYLGMLEINCAPEKTKAHIDEIKRLEEIQEHIRESDGEFYCEMAFQAYTLSSLADIAILYVLTYCNQKEDYSVRIQSHINDMNTNWKNHNNNYLEVSKNFYLGFENLIDKYKEKWDSFYEAEDVKNKLSEIYNRNNEIKLKMKQNPCIKMKDKILDYLNTPKDILICYDENGNRHILQEENNAR